ncbi:MAG TPA: MerR family transcriptional regulator [Rhizorhapis sp.]
MSKADGAFLTIGELAKELNLPQHILRYWESRFPQLKPLQRSGNRRYYRPADVEIARQIHHLLYVEGYTVKGALKALADGNAPANSSVNVTAPESFVDLSTTEENRQATVDLLGELKIISRRLAEALQRSS